METLRRVSYRLGISFWTGVIMSVTGSSVPAWGDALHDRGLAIAIEADERDTGWRDSAGEFEMILRNRHGGESRRHLRSRILELNEDGDKSLVIFDNPKDVQGTAMLTFSHKTGNDDQWLYLPALKRVKRISSSNKSGPFMGSEFAYEDLSSKEIEKYTYQFVGEEEVGGNNCYVIERYPVDKKSGYTKEVVWYDQEHYRVQKAEYYDRKASLLKTLTLKDYRLYLDNYWRAHDLFMENHQTGKSTRLVWINLSFGNGLSARDIDRNSLARVR